MSNVASIKRSPTVPLTTPAGYSLTVAQTCSFFVNVASDMGAQWKKQGFPAPDKFKWTPADPCPYTSGTSLSSYKMGPIIWSTFSYQKKSRTEPFGFVATSDDTAYLVFRGSQTDADFGMDAEFVQVPYTSPIEGAPSGMMVENGFAAVFNGLLEGLVDQLKLVGGKTLLITGHSLGSTLATLSVPVAVSLGLSGAQYNQASPRVGNPAFADYVGGLSIPTFRLVNIYDDVPKMPGSTKNAPYQAVGQQASFGADYLTEREKHEHCCSYSYALFNGQSPFNPDMDACKPPA